MTFILTYSDDQTNEIPVPETGVDARGYMLMFMHLKESNRFIAFDKHPEEDRVVTASAIDTGFPEEPTEVVDYISAMSTMGIFDKNWLVSTVRSFNLDAMLYFSRSVPIEAFDGGVFAEYYHHFLDAVYRTPTRDTFTGIADTKLLYTAEDLDSRSSRVGEDFCSRVMYSILSLPYSEDFEKFFEDSCFSRAYIQVYGANFRYIKSFSCFSESDVEKCVANTTFDYPGFLRAASKSSYGYPDMYRLALATKPSGMTNAEFYEYLDMNDISYDVIEGLHTTYAMPDSILERRTAVDVRHLTSGYIFTLDDIRDIDSVVLSKSIYAKLRRLAITTKDLNGSYSIFESLAPCKDATKLISLYKDVVKRRGGYTHSQFAESTHAELIAQAVNVSGLKKYGAFIAFNGISLGELAEIDDLIYTTKAFKAFARIVYTAFTGETSPFDETLAKLKESVSDSRKTLREAKSTGLVDHIKSKTAILAHDIDKLAEFVRKN